MKIWLSFTDSEIVPNLYAFLSFVDH